MTNIMQKQLLYNSKYCVNTQQTRTAESRQKITMSVINREVLLLKICLNKINNVCKVSLKYV